MSATSRRLRRSIERKSLEIALRTSGCICNYNAVHTGPGRVRIEHDDWCPMIDHASQIIIGIPKKCDR